MQYILFSYKGEKKVAKLKLKNIDNLSIELKNKFNGINSSNMKIGIVVSADNFSERNYSKVLASIVEKEIIKNGFEAEIVIIPALNERFRNFNDNNYVLANYKKQIANFLELTLFDKAFDGVVFIPSGFNSTLGCLLSSIRLNLPTLVLPQGLTPVTENSNLNDVLYLPGEVANNVKSVFDMENVKNSFNEYLGTGCNFTTENIFNIILEIMELSIKNSATTLAGSYEKEEEAVITAQTIVNLTKNRLPLNRMINKKSISNAFMLNLCLGGSPIVIDALMQLSKEAELDIDINKILNTAKDIPVLFDTTHCGFDSYLKKGGTWGLIKAMIKGKLIDGNYKTFSDNILSEEVKEFKVYEEFCIPAKKESIVILRGNIAEKFAITKATTLTEDKTKIIANVQVFSSDQEAYNAVINKAITNNAVIVIKDCGKNTETGVTTIYQTALALESMGLQDKNIIVTDGFVMDDTKVISISFCSPDSNSGNIKYIKDGDEIEIDFIKGRINIEVNAKEMNLRQKKYVKEHRLLPKYITNVQ